jgi:hypothetical protein
MPIIFKKELTIVGEKIQTINGSRPTCQTAQNVGNLNKQNFHLNINRLYPQQSPPHQKKERKKRKSDSRD